MNRLGNTNHVLSFLRGWRRNGKSIVQESMGPEVNYTCKTGGEGRAHIEPPLKSPYTSLNPERGINPDFDYTAEIDWISPSTFQKLYIERYKQDIPIPWLTVSKSQAETGEQWSEWIKINDRPRLK